MKQSYIAKNGDTYVIATGLISSSWTYNESQWSIFKNKKKESSCKKLFGAFKYGKLHVLVFLQRTGENKLKKSLSRSEQMIKVKRSKAAGSDAGISSQRRSTMSED